MSQRFGHINSLVVTSYQSIFQNGLGSKTGLQETINSMIRPSAVPIDSPRMGVFGAIMNTPERPHRGMVGAFDPTNDMCLGQHSRAS